MPQPKVPCSDEKTVCRGRAYRDFVIVFLACALRAPAPLRKPLWVINHETIRIITMISMI